MKDRKRSLPSALYHGLPTVRQPEDIEGALAVFSRKEESGENSEIISEEFSKMSAEAKQKWLLTWPRVHIIPLLGLDPVGSEAEWFEVARDVKKGIILCWSEQKQQKQWLSLPLNNTALFYPNARKRSGQLKLAVLFGNSMYKLECGEIAQSSYIGYGKFGSSETYGRFEFPMASASARIFS